MSSIYIFTQLHARQQTHAGWLLKSLGVAKNDPSTKTSVSSKGRNTPVFCTKFSATILGRKFAIDDASYMSNMQVCGNGATFGFQCVIFKCTRPVFCLN